MGLFGEINLLAFIISFAVGLCIVYVVTPIPKIVYKNPTPYNTDKVVYKTDNQVCYKYRVQPVDCPEDKSKIVDQIFE